MVSKFLPTSEFTWISPKEFDYPLAPDKMEIKREMLSNYQLKIFNILF